jgi:glycosyltransferase involved in cell wall biosynthesis
VQRIFVVHPGTQHALHEACGLAAVGHQVTLLTRLAVGRMEASSLLGRLVVSRYPVRLVDCPEVAVVRLHTAEEVVAVLAQHSLPTPGWRRVFRSLHARFGASAAARVAVHWPDVVIGFDTASRELFRTLEERLPSATRVLEATIASPGVLVALLEKAAARYPAWRSTVDISYHEQDTVAAREEAALADVVTVGCEFAAASYRAMQLPDTTIAVTPYGCDFTPSAGLPATERRGYLFCGTPNLRKGFPDLLTVAPHLPAGEPLHVVGGTPAPALLEPFDAGNVTFHGRLPPPAVRGLMQRVRATVLPSYGEGHGRVLSEALSQGCPIVASRNTGGPTLAEVEPRLAPSIAVVEPGDIDQLLDALRDAERLVSGVRLPVWTWEQYATRLLDQVGH